LGALKFGKTATKKPAILWRVLVLNLRVLNLSQFAAASGTAARDDVAASGRAHAGTEAQFARAWALLRLIGAFHDKTPSGFGWLKAALEKRPQFSRRK